MLLQFIILIPLFLVVITVHEYSHGLVAEALGDPTPRAHGRLTMNPLAHLDPFGTILLPILLMFTFGHAFGYAKPVPVDPRRFRNPRKGMMYVGLAGPLSNFGLAVASGLLLRLPGLLGLQILQMAPLVGWLLMEFAVLNVIIGVFNLIPVPPLDGSRVIAGLLPRQLAHQYAKIEPYGVVVIFVVFFFGGGMVGRFINAVVDPLVKLITG